jgi:hypothetical protein
MHHEAKAQQEFSVDALQHISVAAYPQLCGSWPGDEWPEEVLFEPNDAFSCLCAASQNEYPGEQGARGPL